MAAALSLRNVSHRFGPDTWVLRHLDLELPAGRSLALLGESGVGKSTLLNVAAGLERCTEGSVHVGGQRLTGLDDDGASAIRRRAMGFVFQAFHLLPHLRVWQNVAMPLLLNGVEQAAARVRVDAMLGRLGLGNRAQAWPDELSGGQQQRVAVARALVHEPQVVLADEPTGNLDPATAAETLGALEQATRDRGAALLLVTHSRMAAARMDACVELRSDGLHPVVL